MNSENLRKLLAPLVMWAVPAFFFWFLLGTFVHSRLQLETRQTYRQLEDALHEFAAQKSPEMFMEKALPGLLASIARPPTDQQALKAWRARVFRDLPASALRVFVCDDAGGVRSVAPEDPLDTPETPFVAPGTPRPASGNGGPAPVEIRAAERAAIAAFYRYIRNPAFENVLLEKTAFAGFPAWLKDPVFAATKLRFRGGEVHDCTDGLFAFWDRLPQPALVGRPSGMLAFFRPWEIPETLIFASLAREKQGFWDPNSPALPASSSIQFGLFAQEHEVQTMSTIPSGYGAKLLRAFKRSLGNRFRLGPFLGVGRTDENGTTLLAVAAVPPGFRGIVQVCLLLYACCSLLLLRSAYRRQILREQVRQSIVVKVFALFFLAMGIPFLLALAFARLYIEEKAEGVREEHRRLALEHMITIDRGCKNRIIETANRHALFCRRLSEFEDPRPVVIRECKAMYDQLFLDSYFVYTPDMTPLAELILTFRITGFLRETLALPFAERVERFRHAWKLERAPGQEELALILRPALVFPEDEQERVSKGVRSMAVSAMNYFNLERGFAPVFPERKADLVTAGFMGTQAERMFHLMITRLGKHVVVDDRLFFLDVVPDRSGKSGLFVLLGVLLQNIERDYLREVFAAPSPYEMKAFPLNFSSWMFPDFRNIPIWKQLKKRLTESRGNLLFAQTVLEGRPVEILCFKPSHFQAFQLFAVIPQDLIARDVSRQVRHIAAFFAGALLFGLVLAGILLVSFRAPIQDLIRGLHAIQTKDFQHRLPIRGDDEWGLLAQAFNNAIFHLKDMELAAGIQQDLFPPGPVRLGSWQIEGRNQMNQAIGGDYYDFFPVSEGKTVVVLGDVSGHGVSAALVTAMAKACFTVLCDKFFDNPREILLQTNTLLITVLKKKKMMSCSLVLFDGDHDRVTLLNSGQCYPILINATGTAEFIRMKNSFPLGVTMKLNIALEEISPIPPSLVLYSDGLVEALNDKGQPVGYDTFLTLVQESFQTYDPQSIPQLFQAVSRLTGGIPWGDDATMVALRRLPP
jgi:HAMP domain-containing protein